MPRRDFPLALARSDKSVLSDPVCVSLLFESAVTDVLSNNQPHTTKACLFPHPLISLIARAGRIAAGGTQAAERSRRLQEDHAHAAMAAVCASCLLPETASAADRAAPRCPQGATCRLRVGEGAQIDAAAANMRQYLGRAGLVTPALLHACDPTLLLADPRKVRQSQRFYGS